MKSPRECSQNATCTHASHESDYHFNSENDLQLTDPISISVELLACPNPPTTRKEKESQPRLPCDESVQPQQIRQ